MSTAKCERYSSRRKMTSVGCISWLSHLLPHRHHGKSPVTSSSWSDDDSDSTDVPAATSRHRGGPTQLPSLRQSTSSDDRLPSSPVSAAASPTDLVETFDVYYVLPPPSGGRTLRGRTSPAVGRGWNRYGEMTLTERRRPNTNTLLDAVPPTPSCCTDLRAATLPASFVNDWTPSPPAGFEHYKTPPVPLMYSRPRCACLACSDFTQPAVSCVNTVDRLYRQPTTTTWYNDDNNGGYYNSNEVDVEQLRSGRGCSCHSQARLTAGRQGRSLPQGNPLIAYATNSSYDAVPTPLPLSYANVRYWRTGDDDAEPQYSVPVRLTDSGAVYDNQNTLDRLQTPRRGRHGLTAMRGDGGMTQVNVRPDIGNGGGIMRFVELRQVRAVDDRHGETSCQQRGFQSYVTEDRRYLVDPTVTERLTASHYQQQQQQRQHQCRRANIPDDVYINVQNLPASRTSDAPQTSPHPLSEEETKDFSEPVDCVGSSRTEQDHDIESGKESAELSHETGHLDEENGPSHSATNPDIGENTVQQTEVDDLHETRSAVELSQEMSSEPSVGRVRSQSHQRLLSDTLPARPAAQLRLADAYLLRMSPPPPSQQSDGRRRAAYSDPVRWVSPLSAEPQRRHEIAPSLPTRHGRPNGLRSGKESVVRTAAMTCTTEALDEAIQRRNRKCKPSALRRLQAAKAVGVSVPETAATFASFEPIFEGVTCSLRKRSASLSDCNALSKAHGQTLDF